MERASKQGVTVNRVKSIGLFRISFEGSLEVIKVSKRVPQKTALLYIIALNNQGNHFKERNVKNEEFWACSRQGNNSVTCAVKEVLVRFRKVHNT